MIWEIYIITISLLEEEVEWSSQISELCNHLK